MTPLVRTMRDSFYLHRLRSVKHFSLCVGVSSFFCSPLFVSSRWFREVPSTAKWACFVPSPLVSRWPLRVIQTQARACSTNASASLQSDNAEVEKYWDSSDVQKMERLLHEKEIVFAQKYSEFQMVHHESYCYAQRGLWIFWGCLVGIWCFLLLGTYRLFSWSFIEPITYLLSCAAIGCCVLWYRSMGLEFSIAAFRKVLMEHYYMRYYAVRERKRFSLRGLMPLKRVSMHASDSTPKPTRSIKQDKVYFSQLQGEILAVRQLLRNAKVVSAQQKG